jgi:invasion protein IalB
MRRITMNSGMFICAGTLGAIAYLGLGSIAQAQLPKSTAPTTAAKVEAPSPVDAEPSSTLANFGDWSLRCQRLGNGTETHRVCEVTQQIRAQNEQDPVAELAIGRLKKPDPLRLTIVLPVNITISSPPRFSAEGKVPELPDLGWRKCLPGGCIADALLKDDVLHRWTAQASLTWTNAAGRDLAIGLSSRGLAQALDALSREP